MLTSASRIGAQHNPGCASSSVVQQSSVLMFATVLPNNGGGAAAGSKAPSMKKTGARAGNSLKPNRRPPPPGGLVCTAPHVTCLLYVPPTPSTRLDADTSRRVAFKDFFFSPSSCRPSLQIITPLDRQTLISPLLPSLILSSASISPLSLRLPGVRSQTEREKKLAVKLIPSLPPSLLPLPYGTLRSARPPLLPTCPCCPSSPPSSPLPAPDIIFLLLRSALFAVPPSALPDS